MHGQSSLGAAFLQYHSLGCSSIISPVNCEISFLFFFPLRNHAAYTDLTSERVREREEQREMVLKECLRETGSGVKV